MSISRTPWTLNTANPRVIEIIDAEDEVVLRTDRVCWSSNWKTNEDVDNLVGVRAKDHAQWSKLLQDQMDSMKAIVTAVNEKYAPIGDFSLPSNFTKEDLEDAILTVMSRNRYEAIGGEDSIVLAHEKACMTAFINKLEGPKIDLLRASWDWISIKGVYPFYDAPKP